MNSVKSWRAGAALVLSGGVLLTAAWLAAGTASWIPRVGLVGDLAVGLGLILAGVGIRRRYPACWLLMVAGGAWLLEGVVLLIDAAVALPRGVFTAVLAIVALTTVAAAIGMIVRGRIDGVGRWILVLPALATAAMALVWVAGLPSGLPGLGPWILGAPGVAPLVVGVVWLLVRGATRPQPALSLAAPLTRT
jgi:hypothetical protein